MKEIQRTVDQTRFATYNSWMMLSKFTTENMRDAIPAPQMKQSETIRKNDAVLAYLGWA
jgi:hypothetical protein